MTAIHETNLSDLQPPKRGKVRDIYDLGNELLIIATDRISAYDVILPTPIPGKGEVLTQMSRFWFERTKNIVSNHLSTTPLLNVITNAKEREQLEKRSMIVKKAKPLPVEAVVRGYITGSGWREYQKRGSTSGVKLPAGLKESAKLPEALFTPSTKAEMGKHDENISFDEVKNLIGSELAEKVKEVSLRVYTTCAKYALERGIIIADTKFEFGIYNNELMIIDELLTPDSSRFWPKDQYKIGTAQPSFDKQFVRDYLDTLTWNKQPPGPKLPEAIVQKTQQKYREALDRLTK
ncbi:MAG: phosphoribosylaminoimidazolesuccinocarboxamide synthase [Deltaproteobacteria bacterium RIFCSPLOWO2_02_FULL_44_10]|nr:MAG: phosphoribosylaminoimidazolesuccinocarboxamide synthase [Deltaproteobacteria bacterium RIFCSPHIGHO2_02_FULL_44_16]OGQ46881.1 MAG: phosphoribosylaminoimidazolesuccinocarboxamide synthase [Deltaproteobacteria bacterium RIFCSPLOWO2_02_FULL_44_10]